MLADYAWAIGHYRCADVHAHTLVYMLDVCMMRMHKV